MSDKDSSTALPSGSSTPNPRFVSQNVEAEDRLKGQTLGLVQLSDFRKRRAEALASSTTPIDSDPETATRPTFKKRKAPKKGGLSFGNEDEEDVSSVASSTKISRANTPDDRSLQAQKSEQSESDDVLPVKKKLTANANVGFVAKSQTKNALLKEAQMKEQLRKEFLDMQERVKATEFMLPFVFYDGTDLPGGACRMKKGDQIWLFLERARKVGAEQSSSAGKSVRQWARVSVDDLMLVRGDLIIPPHYEFYHFMLNKTAGYYGQLLPHSAEPTATTPATISELSTPSGGLSLNDPLAKANKSRVQTPLHPDSDLEGAEDDASLTKVVDRRWYEKNKHIFPASTWEDFDPTKDYTSGIRKDTQGNVFFASR